MDRCSRSTDTEIRDSEGNFSGNWLQIFSGNRRLISYFSLVGESDAKYKELYSYNEGDKSDPVFIIGQMVIQFFGESIFSGNWLTKYFRLFRLRFNLKLTNMDTITLNSLGVTLSEQPLISSTSGRTAVKSPKISIHRKHFRYPNGTNHATYTIPITEHAVLVKELNPDTEYAFYLNGSRFTEN